jgi:hypothetical protein
MSITALFMQTIPKLAGLIQSESNATGENIYSSGAFFGCAYVGLLFGGHSRLLYGVTPTIGFGGKTGQMLESLCDVISPVPGIRFLAV